MSKIDDKQVRCSFCGKTQGMVGKLIAWRTEVTVTPTLIGQMVVDFGKFGVAFEMCILGFILGIGFKIMQKTKEMINSKNQHRKHQAHPEADITLKIPIQQQRHSQQQEIRNRRAEIPFNRDAIITSFHIQCSYFDSHIHFRSTKISIS